MCIHLCFCNIIHLNNRLYIYNVINCKYLSVHLCICNGIHFRDQGHTNHVFILNQIVAWQRNISFAGLMVFRYWRVGGERREDVFFYSFFPFKCSFWLVLYFDSFYSYCILLLIISFLLYC